MLVSVASSSEVLVAPIRLPRIHGHRNQQYPRALVKNVIGLGDREVDTEHSSSRLYLPPLPLVQLPLKNATYLRGVNMGVVVVSKVKAFEND